VRNIYLSTMNSLIHVLQDEELHKKSEYSVTDIGDGETSFGWCEFSFKSRGASVGRERNQSELF
jgi:hypothetical protein